jgi:hypothetical protein
VEWFWWNGDQEEIKSDSPEDEIRVYRRAGTELLIRSSNGYGNAQLKIK